MPLTWILPPLETLNSRDRVSCLSLTHTNHQHITRCQHWRHSGTPYLSAKVKWAIDSYLSSGNIQPTTRSESQTRTGSICRIDYQIGIVSHRNTVIDALVLFAKSIVLSWFTMTSSANTRDEYKLIALIKTARDFSFYSAPQLRADAPTVTGPVPL